jgi:nucleoside-diphosphate-sugar epimerase
MSAPLALVTGASGFVGSHIVDELLRRGTPVRCLLRKTSSRRWLDGKPVEIVEGDVRDAAGLDAAVHGADWIVHAAGLTHARSAAEFQEANVHGTELVLAAAVRRRASIRRFVYISSQAASGPSLDGKPVVEDLAPAPVSHYGTTKLIGEELTMLAGGMIPVVSIRPPSVYGPRDDAFLKLFRWVQRGVFPVFRRAGRVSLIHAEDLARAVGLALEDERAVGGIYFAAEPEMATYGDLGQAVIGGMGKRALTVKLPTSALLAAAFVGEAWGAVTRTPPFLTREKLREIAAGDWIVSSAKIREELGWTPKIALAEGIRGTAEWYRQAGWI